MDKKISMLIAAVLVVGIAFFSALVLANLASSFKFEFEKDSVLFVSNEAAPVDLMREFNLNDTVFVSPALFESGPENSTISASFNLLQVVFIGNDKNTVSLWRVMDRKGNLISCRTNNGDIKNDIELSVQDCQRILDDKNNAIILVSFPAVQTAKSRIVFSQNRIEIVPDKIDNLANVSFTFLKTMYANAELIITKTNQFTKFVK